MPETAGGHSLKPFSVVGKEADPTSRCSAFGFISDVRRGLHFLWEFQFPSLPTSACTWLMTCKIGLVKIPGINCPT